MNDWAEENGWAGRFKCMIRKYPFSVVAPQIKKLIDARARFRLVRTITLVLTFTVGFGCQGQSTSEPTTGPDTSMVSTEEKEVVLVQPEGETIQTRFSAPAGYERIESPPNSFADYLRRLPLKPAEAEVKYYNGRTKYNNDVYIAVVDIDVGTRDLQQCADAVMRLRAEHLWAQQAYDDIHFNFTNGWRADYNKWREGYRVKVDGNKTNWYKAGDTDTSYRSFRRYLDLIFAYAGTRSLSRELNRVDRSDLQIGDVFIQGGSPGHAVIVVDMAVQPETGKKVFLLAQSYMPAQDIQILQNPMNNALNPWYELDFGEMLYTPERTFRAADLMRFP